MNLTCEVNHFFVFNEFTENLIVETRTHTSGSKKLKMPSVFFI